MREDRAVLQMEQPDKAIEAFQTSLRNITDPKDRQKLSTKYQRTMSTFRAQKKSTQEGINKKEEKF